MRVSFRLHHMYYRQCGEYMPAFDGRAHIMAITGTLVVLKTLPNIV